MVFEEVRKAQPAQLFLYQDGLRDERDLEDIMACRKIVENIDWPCKVHKKYQSKNFGCDPSEFLSQKWAFSITDKCIVLEDDDLPSQSFFVFCKEMLDRYENDERIGMIAGFNQEERTKDVGDDSYFFTSNFSIWGWASWKRVVDRWEGKYEFLDDPDAITYLEDLVNKKKLRKDFLPMCRAHKSQEKPFYETIFHACLLLNSQWAIVPTYNLINNIGVVNDSTHFSGSIQTLPRGYRRIFTMKRYELDFPLHHPKDIVEHPKFRARVYKIMAWGHPWVKFSRSFEELYLNLFHGQWQYIGKAIQSRLQSIFFGKKYK